MTPLGTDHWKNYGGWGGGVGKKMMQGKMPGKTSCKEEAKEKNSCKNSKLSGAVFDDISFLRGSVYKG